MTRSQSNRRHRRTAPINSVVAFSQGRPERHRSRDTPSRFYGRRCCLSRAASAPDLQPADKPRKRNGIRREPANLSGRCSGFRRGLSIGHRWSTEHHRCLSQFMHGLPGAVSEPCHARAPDSPSFTSRVAKILDLAAMESQTFVVPFAPIGERVRIISQASGATADRRKRILKGTLIVGVAGPTAKCRTGQHLHVVDPQARPDWDRRSRGSSRSTTLA